MRISMTRTIKVMCSGCGRKSDEEAWFILNVQENPEAKKELLEGSLNLFRCKCGCQEFFAVDLLYIDEEKGFCVQLVPFEYLDRDAVLDSFDKNGKFWGWRNLRASLREPLEEVHIVFAMDELARYVVFRDKLAERHKGAKGYSLICFACGRPIRSGERYFCISRIQQVKGDADENEDTIIDAWASLQVCAECKTQAATQDIAFLFLPLIPVLSLEKKAISRYARRRAAAGNEWKPVKNGRDSCSLCQTPIAVGDNYTRVELAEEAENTEGVIHMEEGYTLAILCEKCVKKYVEWAPEALTVRSTSGGQRMSQVDIKWHEVDVLEDGHGVVFLYTGVSPRRVPVAFLPGDAWRDSPVAVQVVQVLRPELLAERFASEKVSVNAAEVINVTKQAVATFLSSKELMSHGYGPINKDVSRIFNA